MSALLVVAGLAGPAPAGTGSVSAKAVAVTEYEGKIYTGYPFIFNQCLDADLSTIGGNGTKVMLWDCWSGANQQWRAGYLGDGYWVIKNGKSGRCLDADLGTIGGNGTTVWLWDCQFISGSALQYQLNQVWYRWLADGREYWINAYSWRCLDADAQTIGTSGTKVMLWDCWHSANQSWVNAAIP